MIPRIRHETFSLCVLSVVLVIFSCISMATLHAVEQSPAAVASLESAPVLAIIRVDRRTERIATTFEGEDLGFANGRLRTYWSHEGDLVRVIHLNGKSADDPDLFGGVAIEQVERERKGIRLELGRSYLLLLRRSRHWYWAPECSHGCTLLPASFELAAEQGGYEIRNDRLRVLRRGGPLDAFDGRGVDELIAALTKAK